MSNEPRIRCDAAEGYALLCALKREALHRCMPAPEELAMLLRHGQKDQKYSIVTQALACALEPRVDILATHDDVGERAVSMRTLCEEAVVPFEQRELPGSLGGSKQPYNCKRLLGNRRLYSKPDSAGTKESRWAYVINTLTTIGGDGPAAREFLLAALTVLIQVHAEAQGIRDAVQVLPLNQRRRDSRQLIERFVRQKKTGGRRLQTAVAAAYMADPRFSVGVIKAVNSADAPSGAAGDVEARREDGTLLAVEVKDRALKPQDIDDSAHKAQRQTADVLFIVQPDERGHIATDPDGVQQRRDLMEDEGMSIHILSFNDWLDSFLAEAAPSTRSQLLDELGRLLTGDDLQDWLAMRSL